jgi:aldose 1-epimerase
VVSAVGATLREFTYEGRDLVVPFPADRVRPLYRGALIAPWANRLANGRYTWNGVEYQAAINEPDRNNALHGLVHWIRWDLLSQEPDRLVLRHDLVAQESYPFPLRLVAEFTLRPAGLTTTLTATNIGASSAPYACCPHPYLVAGNGPVDGWELILPANTRLEVDERLLPTETRPVEDVDCDFRQGGIIGARAIDHAFTDVLPAEDGRTTVVVRDPSGTSGVSLSWGSWAPWVQIHTADRPESENNRVGLAVEPMNGPPDAFNRDPTTLEPGQSHVAEWTIAALSS